MLETYVEEVEREKNRIFKIAKSKYPLIRYSDMENIYQDSFLHIIKTGINAYDSSREFLPWFIKCFLNKCVDYIRVVKRRRMESVNFSDYENLDKIKSLWYFDKSESGHDISGYVDKLNLCFREVINLRYWEDMKDREISKRLGVHRTTIINRFHKAKNKLVQYLKPFAV